MQDIDETKLVVLMVAGSIFTLVGIFLLFRKPEEGKAAQIEIFGLKFQASSAGLTVFLIGAVFLASPIFVPERKNESMPQNPVPKQVDSNERHASPLAEESNTNSGKTVVLPSGPNAKEIEPNDRVQEANQIAIGPTYSGRVKGEDRDWFVVPTSDLRYGQLEVGVRHIAGTGGRLVIYDEKERNITYMGISDGASYKVVDIEENQRIYLEISVVHHMEYELFLAEKKEGN